MGKNIKYPILLQNTQFIQHLIVGKNIKYPILFQNTQLFQHLDWILLQNIEFKPPDSRVCIENCFSYFSFKTYKNVKVLKRTVSMSGSIYHQKQMFQLMDKKIITILRSKNLLIWIINVESF